MAQYLKLENESQLTTEISSQDGPLSAPKHANTGETSSSAYQNEIRSKFEVGLEKVREQDQDKVFAIAAKFNDVERSRRTPAYLFQRCLRSMGHQCVAQHKSRNATTDICVSKPGIHATALQLSC